MSVKPSSTLYSHPFSKAYWRDAAGEFRDVRILIFTALMIALRLILKSVKIPVAPSLNINIQFFVNALGSMVYGPVVALLAGAVSDTLGYLLFPSGPYFPGFLLTEMAGGLIFLLAREFPGQHRAADPDHGALLPDGARKELRLV